VKIQKMGGREKTWVSWCPVFVSAGEEKTVAKNQHAPRRRPLRGKRGGFHQLKKTEDGRGHGEEDGEKKKGVSMKKRRGTW